MDKLVRRATVGETKVSNLKVNSRTTDPVGEGAGQTLFPLAIECTLLGGTGSLADRAPVQ